MSGMRVDVVSPEGEAGTVDDAELPQAVASGFHVVTPEEATAARMSPLEQAGAFSAGALRGLSLGTSDYILPGLIGGMPGEAEQGLQDIQKAAPGLSEAGEVAGNIGLLAATGGAGSIGEATGAGVTRALGGGFGARLAGRVAGGALAAGIENTAIDAGKIVSEDALGSPQLNGESVAATLGKSFLSGAAVGGVLHGTLGTVGEALSGEAADLGGRLASRGSKIDQFKAADVERLAEQKFGEAAPGIGEKFRDWYAKGASAISGKDEATIRNLIRSGREGAEGRATAVFDADEVLAKASRDFRKAGDEAIAASNSVSEEAKGALKAGYVAKAVKQEGTEEVAALASARAKQAIESVAAELEHPEGYAKNLLPAYENTSKAAYRLESRIQEAVKSGENANGKIFMAMDEFKRDLQARAANTTAVRGGLSDPESMRAHFRGADFFKSLSETVRNDLQNESLFGKAAVDQRKINEAWARQIEARPRVNQALLTDVGRDPLNPFAKQMGVDPAKADTFLRNLTSPNKDLTNQAIKEWIQATEDHTKAIRDAYDLPAAKAAEADRVISSLGKLRDTMQSSEGAVSLANQYRELTSGGGDGTATLLGMLGLSAGGPIGGAVGGAIGALANPGRTVAQLAAVERMGEKVRRQFTTGARDFVKAAPAASHPYRSLPDVAKQAKAIATASPEALVERMSRSLQQVADGAPKTSQAAATTLFRAAAYLSKEAPKVPASHSPWQKPREDDLSPIELARFARKVEVVEDPARVVTRMRDGTLTRDHVATLREVYPELYAFTKQTVLEMAIDRKDPMTLQQQAALSILWDQPVHAIFDPENIKAFQQNANTAPPNSPAPPPRGGPVKVNASRLETASNRGDTDV